jgi:hypothetical protein
VVYDFRWAQVVATEQVEIKITFCFFLLGKHYGKSVDWMDATGKELTLWKSMLERPNFWVEGCLSLRPSLDTRTS